MERTDSLSITNPEYVSAFCPVCFCPYRLGRNGFCKVAFANCGHVGHKKCIESIVGCPLCRRRARRLWQYRLFFNAAGRIPACRRCREMLHPDMEIYVDFFGFCCSFCKPDEFARKPRKVHLQFGNQYDDLSDYDSSDDDGSVDYFNVNNFSDDGASDDDGSDYDGGDDDGSDYDGSDYDDNDN